jgi:thioester reductase-like protein
MATALLTGFPGFIGKRLVAKLLADDPKLGVVALVEERMLDAAREAAAEIDAKQIEVVAGDIGQRGLGLVDSDREALAKSVTVVFHLAAIYDLAVPLAIAQRVNVDGTGNVLEFCLGAKKLERLAYVSTAYVSGRRTGRIY